MERLRSRFRGLQWRLTLSYTLLTVAAVLAIGVTFVTLVNRFIFDSSVFPAMVASDLTGVAPQATPYLLRNPVDQAGLRLLAWQDTTDQVVAYMRERGDGRLEQQLKSATSADQRKRYQRALLLRGAYLEALSSQGSRTGVLVAERI